MDHKKIVFFSGLTLLALMGCATAEDAGTRALIRQQSETIESLNKEILRLNEELDGTVDGRADLQAAKPKAEENLAPEISRGDVRIAMDSRGMVVTVLDHALFDPDETQFTSSGEAVLEKIALVLTRDLPRNRVALEGHTDNQPIENANGITNWEYSIGRATAVLHFFLENKELFPERFRVVGYAEYRPVASNDTEEGRDKNRRVEIVIVPERIPDGSAR
jgi:chemotaxis protein MotB